MTFDDLPAGSSVFLDANTLVYPFAPEPVLGPPCAKLMRRIEDQQLVAFTATHVQQLTTFRQTVETILQSRIQVLTISCAWIVTAAALSQQTGLLSNDALIVAVMQNHGLVNLASNDADFDRVAGLTRYSPA